MPVNKPIFTISLDFELFWGVRDHRTIEEYGPAILGARKAIPFLLDLFKEYNIHATWATVGFLFNESKTEFLTNLPKDFPHYSNASLSPYPSLPTIGENENEDPFHFGLSLINKILNAPFQEIGTHTYSHYYCLEKGQSLKSFEEDFHLAIKIAKDKNIEISSIIFPRNQFSADHINLLEKNSITAYRGTENSWLYSSRNRENESLIRRFFRLMDSYINLTGHHVYALNTPILSEKTTNIPSSRFLRPYSPKLQLLDRLKLLRIKKSMLAAAKQNKVFHLWWHPHNFGTYTEQNLKFLKEVLAYYSALNKSHGMISLNMKEIAGKTNGKV